MKKLEWFHIKQADTLLTPNLVVYPERIKLNVERMLKMMGDNPSNLRPHIKTHKMAEVIKLQLNKGITKFKSATIKESELLAKCNAPDILLAMQPVGVIISQFFDLIVKYPNCTFSTLVDNRKTLSDLEAFARFKGIPLNLWLDINNGMNRTGIKPNSEAVSLYTAMDENPIINAKGFHVYDGHIHDADLGIRKQKVDKAFESVSKLKAEVEENGIKIESIIAGGTPSFPIHKDRKGVEVSPGTPLLWDAGYGNNYKDLNFLPAAVLLTRVISKPSKGLICFDLGHKAVAAEMDFPRVAFLEENDFIQISQSEEHLVVKSENTNGIEIGQLFYVLPIHICPTVIKYEEVLCIVNAELSGNWKIAARDH